ncbi:MAG: hypothetical protein K9L74_03180 [Candidatus Izimaplasma sp.]|nr:hypothetical protein [Candidatus Izimaplasma bacterium]
MHTVKEEDPSNIFTSIATLHESSSLEDIVEFQGILVGIVDGGYFLTDGQHVISVYGGSPDFELGDEVYVKGAYAVYNTLYQISSPSEETLISTGNEDPLTPVVKSVSEVLNLDSSDPLIHGMPYIVTGNLEVRGDYDNLYLVQGDDALLISYYSIPEALTVLEGFVGKEVTIEVFYYTDHGTNGPMVAFQGTVDDVEVNEFSDKEALEADIASLDLPEVTNTDVVLPVTGPNGSTFSNWTSSNTAVIDSDGTFVAKAAETVTVTFTATATKGAESEDVSYDVVVPVNSTVAEALAMDDNELLQVTGVIYDISYYGFFIHEGGNYLFIFSQDLTEEVAVGDEITLLGSMGTYSGLRQVNPHTHTVLSSDNALPTAVETTVGAVENDVVARGTIATITGTVSIEGSYDNAFITGPAGGKVQIYYRTNADAVKEFDGQTITLTVITYQNGTVLYQGTVDDIAVYDGTWTDAEKAQAAVNAISFDADLTQVEMDLTLPAENTLVGATFTWASNNTAVVDVDGTVNRVAGQDTVVTLTVTATVGTETVTRDIAVTVLDANDAEPSTIAEALLLDNGTSALVEGVVTGFDSYGTFIQDPDGTAIYVYDYKGDLVVGDLVILRGDLGSYNGVRQLSNASLIELVSSDNAIFVKTDVTPTELATDPDSYQGQRLTMDLVVNQLDDGYGMVFFDGITDVFIKFSKDNYAPNFADNFAVGDTITVTFNVYGTHYGNVRLDAVTFPVESIHNNSAIDDTVELTGIVTTVFDGGYFLSDGVNSIGIYGSSLDSVAVGDEIHVVGSYASYYTLYQISGLTTEEVISTGNTVVLTPETLTVSELVALDATKTVHGQEFTVTGTIELRGDYNNVYIVDGNDALEVYYKSPADSITALEAQVGNNVTVTVTYYTNKGGGTVLVVFQGIADDITVN